MKKLSLFWNEKIGRREFLKKTFKAILVTGIGSIFWDAFSSLSAKTNLPLRREALFYKKINDLTVQCQLCPRRCVLADGQRSFCRAREPKADKLYSLVWALACAVHVDPIEKKPLFHFLPGTSIFSIATAGCNFRCKFCQNWQISQFPPEETSNYFLPPEEIIKKAIENNCPSIAYTYSEPSIFYEYMLDTAKLAKKYGIKNMYHSNGSLNEEPVQELSYYLDGANIDLKSFRQEFYTNVCAGYLHTVLNTLKVLKRNRVWLEITNLIIPTLNDNLEDIKKMAIWIKENLGDEVPIHFSRFWPQYKLKSLPPTPVTTLEKARQKALEVGLKFVYVGNVPGHPGENTYCPRCKKVLIRRVGYSILENNLIEGKCRFCQRSIPGVWS
jgi:pyruvate formate lyase activating enzyme